jgi:hypothetical protein
MLRRWRVTLQIGAQPAVLWFERKGHTFAAPKDWSVQQADQLAAGEIRVFHVSPVKPISQQSRFSHSEDEACRAHFPHSLK